MKTLRQPGSILFCAFGLLLLTAGMAEASTIIVINNNTAGPGSLYQAIQDANDGDVINFDMNQVVSPVPWGNAGGSSEITKSFSIVGPGADQLTITNSWTFSVDQGVTLTMTNVSTQFLTLTNTAAVNYQIAPPKLILTGCTMEFCAVTYFAGVLHGCHITGNSRLALTGVEAIDTTIDNHAAFGFSGPVSLTNCTISTDNGGITDAGDPFNLVYPTPAHTINNCSISVVFELDINCNGPVTISNCSLASQGSINVSAVGNCSITGCTATGPMRLENPGVDDNSELCSINVAGAAVFNISNCSFTGYPLHYQPGTFASNGTLNVSDTSISLPGNANLYGQTTAIMAGIKFEGANSVSLTRCQVDSAIWGIYTGGASTITTVEDCSVTHCGVTDPNADFGVGGGGIYAVQVAVDRCYIADCAGAGIADFEVFFSTVRNTTIARCDVGVFQATSIGDGPDGFYEHLTITDCNIAVKSTFGAGLQNSIVCRNQTCLLEVFESLGFPLSASGCLFAGNVDLPDVEVDGGTFIPDASRLSAVGMHGGLYPTVLPLPGSEAIDNAVGAIGGLDGRGFPRQIGAAEDIGAVETAYAVAPFAGTPQTTAIQRAFATALQLRLTESGLPVSGDTVTFTAPAAGGATGTFPGSSGTATAVTDADGVAIAPAFTANGVLGSYTVNAATPDVAGSGAFALKNLNNFAGWQALHFTAEELADQGISGPDADPDGDGLTNLQECAAGTDPNVPNIPGITVTVGAGTVALTFPQTLTVGGLSYSVETSTDLATWTPVTTTDSILSSGVEQQMVQSQVALGNPAPTKLFLHQLVTLLP